MSEMDWLRAHEAWTKRALTAEAEIERLRGALSKIAAETTQWNWPKDATVAEAMTYVAVQMRDIANKAIALPPSNSSGEAT